MKIYFYLSTKRINSKGKAPIYCRFHETSQNRTDISTGISIYPCDWDSKCSFVKRSLPFEHDTLTIFKQKAEKLVIQNTLQNKNSTYSIARELKGTTKILPHRISQYLNDFTQSIQAKETNKKRLESFVRKFEKKYHTPIQHLSTNFPKEYEKHLIQQGYFGDYSMQ